MTPFIGLTLSPGDHSIRTEYVFTYSSDDWFIKQTEACFHPLDPFFCAINRPAHEPPNGGCGRIDYINLT
jgi:hypothetical protein